MLKYIQRTNIYKMIPAYLIIEILEREKTSYDFNRENESKYDDMSVGRLVRHTFLFGIELSIV